jgi:hypothetical protein
MIPKPPGTFIINPSDWEGFEYIKHPEQCKSPYDENRVRMASANNAHRHATDLINNHLL